MFKASLSRRRALARSPEEAWGGAKVPPRRGGQVLGRRDDVAEGLSRVPVELTVLVLCLACGNPASARPADPNSRSPPVQWRSVRLQYRSTLSHRHGYYLRPVSVYGKSMRPP